ncbi:hypothetical protein D9M72_447410 [compost metagenome]
MRAVGADDLFTFLAKEAVGRTGLEEFLADELFGLAVGLRNIVARSLERDLQVLDFAEIAGQRLAGLEGGLNHDIEKC